MLTGFPRHPDVVCREAHLLKSTEKLQAKERVKGEKDLARQAEREQKEKEKEQARLVRPSLP